MDEFDFITLCRMFLHVNSDDFQFPPTSTVFDIESNLGCLIGSQLPEKEKCDGINISSRWIIKTINNTCRDSEIVEDVNKMGEKNTDFYKQLEHQMQMWESLESLHDHVAALVKRREMSPEIGKEHLLDVLEFAIGDTEPDKIASKATHVLHSLP